jgi:hypothetical protein
VVPRTGVGAQDRLSSVDPDQVEHRADLEQARASRGLVQQGEALHRRAGQVLARTRQAVGLVEKDSETRCAKTRLDEMTQKRGFQAVRGDLGPVGPRALRHLARVERSDDSREPTGADPGGLAVPPLATVLRDVTIGGQA